MGETRNNRRKPRTKKRQLEAKTMKKQATLITLIVLTTGLVSASPTVLNDLDDCDVSDWTGSTGQLSADSTTSYSGSCSAKLEATTGNFLDEGVFWNTSTHITPEQTSFAFRFGGSLTDQYMRYGILDDDGDIMVRINEYSNSNPNVQINGHDISISADTWYKLRVTNIDYQNQRFDWVLLDSSGNPIDAEYGVSFLDSSFDTGIKAYAFTDGSNAESNPMWMDEITKTTKLPSPVKESFEDGDYTSNPAWTESRSNSLKLEVNQEHSFDGDYALEAYTDTSDNSGIEITEYTWSELPNIYNQTYHVYNPDWQNGARADFKWGDWNKNDILYGSLFDGRFNPNDNTNNCKPASSSPSLKSSGWYTVKIEWDKANERVRWWLIDPATDNVVSVNGWENCSDASKDNTYERVAIEAGQFEGSGSIWWDMVSYDIKSNSPPNIDSVNTSPVNPRYGDKNIDALMNASDPNGDSLNAQVTVREDGNVIVNNQSMNTGTTNDFKATDLFNADEKNTWYNLTFYVDDGSATNSTKISRYTYYNEGKWVGDKRDYGFESNKELLAFEVNVTEIPENTGINLSLASYDQDNNTLTDEEIKLDQEGVYNVTTSASTFDTLQWNYTLYSYEKGVTPELYNDTQYLETGESYSENPSQNLDVENSETGQAGRNENLSTITNIQGEMFSETGILVKSLQNSLTSNSITETIQASVSNTQELLNQQTITETVNLQEFLQSNPETDNSITETIFTATSTSNPFYATSNAYNNILTGETTSQTGNIENTLIETWKPTQQTGITPVTATNLLTGIQVSQNLGQAVTEDNIISTTVNLGVNSFQNTEILGTQIESITTGISSTQTIPVSVSKTIENQLDVNIVQDTNIEQNQGETTSPQVNSVRVNTVDLGTSTPETELNINITDPDNDTVGGKIRYADKEKQINSNQDIINLSLEDTLSIEDDLYFEDSNGNSGTFNIGFQITDTAYTQTTENVNLTTQIIEKNDTFEVTGTNSLNYSIKVEDYNASTQMLPVHHTGKVQSGNQESVLTRLKGDFLIEDTNQWKQDSGRNSTIRTQYASRTLYIENPHSHEWQNVETPTVQPPNNFGECDTCSRNSRISFTGNYNNTRYYLDSGDVVSNSLDRTIEDIEIGERDTYFEQYLYTKEQNTINLSNIQAVEIINDTNYEARGFITPSKLENGSFKFNDGTLEPEQVNSCDTSNPGYTQAEFYNQTWKGCVEDTNGNQKPDYFKTVIPEIETRVKVRYGGFTNATMNETGVPYPGLKPCEEGSEYGNLVCFKNQWRTEANTQRETLIAGRAVANTGEGLGILLGLLATIFYISRKTEGTPKERTEQVVNTGQEKVSKIWERN
jgi:hypothetical protein